MSNNTLKFNIHGDNIVECERTLSFIIQSFSEKMDVTILSESITCPSFLLKINELKIDIYFTFYPGFSRWEKDILSLVQDMGGFLRETPDAIVTRIDGTHEIPILSIEFCGALPAGNQAWQRSGRAYSYGQAGIPYFYIAELGGFELTSKREKKAERNPNPAVPYSYIAYSKDLDTSTLPVFIPSVGASVSSKDYYDKIFGIPEFLHLLKKIILNENFDCYEEILENKTLELIGLLAESRRNNDSLTKDQWKRAFSLMRPDSSLIDYLITIKPLSWSKVAYIKDLTKTASDLMNLGSIYGIGLSSSTLPMCVIPKTNRQRFLEEVKKIYPNFSTEFINWLSRDEHLAICWVMGFKPGHDDARPDRGLPPFCRMLSGQKTDILTIIYGPAPPAHWGKLKTNPGELMVANGLWQSILISSDAILVDSATMAITDEKGYTKSHWQKYLPVKKSTTIFIPPVPARFGEHDVDTILHLLFRHFGGSEVFEGMCNPPGGDWSGISVKTYDQKKILRWLSLPRVSGEHSKRPDHVFEIFDKDEKPILLIIESKDTATRIEKNIGNRLTEYVKDLLISEPSAEYNFKNSKWCHSTETWDESKYQMASAVAYIIQSGDRIEVINERSNVDIICGFYYDSDTKLWTIFCRPNTEIGLKIFNFMQRCEKNGFGIILKKI